MHTQMHSAATTQSSTVITASSVDLMCGCTVNTADSAVQYLPPAMLLSRSLYVCVDKGNTGWQSAIIGDKSQRINTSITADQAHRFLLMI